MGDITNTSGACSGCETCPFKTSLDPYECQMVHRDVKEARDSQKELLEAVHRIDKALAINNLKTTLVSSVVTTLLFAGLNYVAKIL